MRVSGERQRNRLNASPENFASAMNAGSPASSRIATRPRREVHQQRSEADERDSVLDEPERAHHEAERPARRFTSRARELVVELRVLEVAQIQRERLLQDHHVHALAELRTQQPLAER